MNSPIEIHAAGIVMDMRFCNWEAFDVYIEVLANQMTPFRITQIANDIDGTLRVRIVQQYNDTDLIQL